MNLKEQRREIVAKARSLAETAKASGRDLTAEEVTTVNDAVEQVKGLDVKIKAADEGADMLATIGSVHEPKSAQELLKHRTNKDQWGRAKNGFDDRGQPFGDPDGFVRNLRKNLEGGNKMTGNIVLNTSPAARKEAASNLAANFQAGVESKGVFTPGAIIEPTPVFDQPVLLPSEPLLRLSDMLTVKKLERGQFSYLRQTTQNDAAAFVKPGDLKPVSSYGFDEVQGELKMLATLSEPIHEVWIQDHSEVIASVFEQLLKGIFSALDTAIINGDGLGQNLTGLLNASGIQVQAAGDDNLATTRAAVTKLEVLGYTPGLYLVNPLDWEKIELTRDLNNSYVLDSTPVDRAARRMWGVPVLPHTGVPQGTVLLMDPSAAHLLTDPVMKMVASFMGEDFQRNQIHTRAEQRFELAVTNPLGIVKITLPVPAA